MSQKPLIPHVKGVVTHYRPDLDAIACVWHAIGCQVLFPGIWKVDKDVWKLNDEVKWICVGAGGKPSPRQLAEGWNREGLVAFDTGTPGENPFFELVINHEPKDQYPGKCALDLLVERTQLEMPVELLDYIRATDFGRPAQQDAFDLMQIVKAIHRMNPDDPLPAVQFAWKVFNYMSLAENHGLTLEAFRDGQVTLPRLSGLIAKMYPDELEELLRTANSAVVHEKQLFVQAILSMMESQVVQLPGGMGLRVVSCDNELVSSAWRLKPFRTDVFLQQGKYGTQVWVNRFSRLKPLLLVSLLRQAEASALGIGISPREATLTGMPEKIPWYYWPGDPGKTDSMLFNGSLTNPDVDRTRLTTNEIIAVIKQTVAAATSAFVR